MHSNCTKPVTFFAAQSSLGGAQFSFGEEHAVILRGTAPKCPPWCRACAEYVGIGEYRYKKTAVLKIQIQKMLVPILENDSTPGNASDKCYLWKILLSCLPFFWLETFQFFHPQMIVTALRQTLPQKSGMRLEVESSGMFLASRTLFEVLGLSLKPQALVFVLGFEAYRSSKNFCTRLQDSIILWSVKKGNILIKTKDNLNF